ncbi:MAG TPA: enolase C-terminal domain-like protein, partial [Euzebyales bacterium]|nr:enolase C-terminal domain-like protein [Euzebyales bacterium]
MKIASVDTIPVSLPLSRPVQMSHVTVARSHNVLVRITTDEGVVGWGEGVSAPDLTGEDQGRIKAGIDGLGARIVGLDPLARTAVWQRLREAVAGNATAIGALDIALHDIAGKAFGVPVSALIGGAARSRIPALVLLGSGDPDADLATFRRHHDAGVRWFKLKLGIGPMEAEVETLRRLRAAGPDAVLCGDANGGWTEQRSARFLDAIADLDVRFIEQPTLRTAALLRLAARSPVALCADESADSLDALLSFAGTALAGVSLKLIKHGGITGVMRGAALCDQVGLHVNLAGKIAESAISAAANLHCAAAMGDTHYGCSPANHTLTADVCAAPPRITDGAYDVPTG